MATRVNGIFDDNLINTINDTKILVVGAGGIGCELLKNLVLTGFEDIEVVSAKIKSQFYTSFPAYKIPTSMLFNVFHAHKYVFKCTIAP